MSTPNLKKSKKPHSQKKDLEQELEECQKQSEENLASAVSIK